MAVELESLHQRIAELKIKLAEAESSERLAHNLFANRLVECDQLREQVTLLRDALLHERSLYLEAGSDMEEQGVEALAATEPKE